MILNQQFPQANCSDWNGSWVVSCLANIGQCGQIQGNGPWMPFNCPPRNLDTIAQSLGSHFVRIPFPFRIHSAFIKNSWISMGFGISRAANVSFVFYQKTSPKDADKMPIGCRKMRKDEDKMDFRFCAFDLAPKRRCLIIHFLESS